MHMECTQPEEIHTSVMHYFNTMSTLWDIVGVDVCIAVRTFLKKSIVDVYTSGRFMYGFFFCWAHFMYNLRRHEDVFFFSFSLSQTSHI